MGHGKFSLHMLCNLNGISDNLLSFRRQLAALAFGLLVLLASPTLTFESKE